MCEFVGTSCDAVTLMSFVPDLPEVLRLCLDLDRPLVEADLVVAARDVQVSVL